MERNIRRIDNDVNCTYAWFVQIQRNSEIHWKMFTDGVYGSKRKALKAAREFKEQILTAVSTPKYHLKRRTILRKNNTSGTPGVGRYDVLTNPRTGTRRIYWMAFWDDANGVRKSRKFSVLMHGEEKAKKLAISERKRQLKNVCTEKYI